MARIADLYTEDSSFNDFVFGYSQYKCGRNGRSAELPYRPVHRTLDINGYQEKIQRLSEELAEAHQWTLEEAEAKAKSDYDEDVAYYKQREEEDLIILERCEIMLQEVQNWEPPSPDHKELKEVMIKDLSREVTRLSSKEYTPIPLRSGEEYKELVIKGCSSMLSSYIKTLEKEAGEVAAHNQWIDYLYQSLGEEYVD